MDDNRVYKLQEKQTEKVILIGTMKQIDRWLENFSEQDVVYEIYQMNQKCHQMSQDVTKCH